MNKTKKIVVLVAIVCAVVSVSQFIGFKVARVEEYGSDKASVKSASVDVLTPKLINRTKLIKEAWKLSKNGQFDEALNKYELARSPEYLEEPADATMAYVGSARIFSYQAKYVEALRMLNLPLRINAGKFEPLREELLALKHFSETSNADKVYKHIAFLKTKYKKIIPPVANGATGVVSKILRLYDAIGDHDAGISYINTCLAFFESEAMKRNLEFKLEGWLLEYVKVREAFERDKAEGTKGRATRALIQSDYFPWT